MVFSGINGRGGPCPCEDLMPQCRGLPGWGGKSEWVDGEHLLEVGGRDKGFLEEKRGHRITIEM